jgi:hypothetical protein
LPPWARARAGVPNSPHIAIASTQTCLKTIRKRSRIATIRAASVPVERDPTVSLQSAMNLLANVEMS